MGVGMEMDMDMRDGMAWDEGRAFYRDVEKKMKEKKRKEKKVNKAITTYGQLAHSVNISYLNVSIGWLLWGGPGLKMLWKKDDCSIVMKFVRESSGLTRTRSSNELLIVMLISY